MGWILLMFVVAVAAIALCVWLIKKGFGIAVCLIKLLLTAIFALLAWPFRALFGAIREGLR